MRCTDKNCGSWDAYGDFGNEYSVGGGEEAAQGDLAGNTYVSMCVYINCRTSCAVSEFCT
jgi:hypothetical protein